MEARKEVIQFLQLARMMKEGLPDGQWEDGLEELWNYIKEERPKPDDPFWNDALEEINRNKAWWV